MLIGLRRVRGAYTGEVILERLIEILKDFNIIENLGYIMADNDAINDKVVRLVLKELRLNIKNLAQRRVRCIGYMLNLVYKAFLFNHSTAVLE